MFTKRKLNIKTVLIYLVAMIIGLCVALVTELKASPIVIKYDLGGSIEQRTLDIKAIGGNEVIIDGVCASSCTMLLKVACVTTTSKPYFHGPSSQFYGVGLSQKEFDKWSKVMASYYPKKLKNKFMNEWRYVTVGVIMVTGKDLIETYDVKECMK